MNRLSGDNIQKLNETRLRQDFLKQNHVIEMSLSNRISVEHAFTVLCMRADCFFERSYFLITLTSSLYNLFLQIPAEQQNCTSSTWNIFKSRLVTLFVSFNFCIFLLLIMKTKTLHNYHERIIISCKRI